MLAFLDLETTGLEPKTGSILELALVLTDDDLNELAVYESLVRPIHLRGPEAMDVVVKEMHRRSGLLDQIWDLVGDQADPQNWKPRDVPRCGEVEIVAVGWLGNSVGVPSVELPKIARQIPLAGNSVHFDRAWIREHMPDLERLFSHRNVDVSTLTELAKRWTPDKHASRPGANGEIAHRALADVRQSIETLKFYRGQLFPKRWITDEGTLL